MISCKPHKLSVPVQNAVQRWTKEQSTALFALILERTTDIDRQLVDKIYARRLQFKGIENIDVILHSHGGDIEAAYQLITFIRPKCKKLRVFIPDWAKSAATLFVLGADEIWMSESAELGPLDAQIPDPRDPDGLISALDEFRAIDYMRQHGHEIFDEFTKLLIRRTRTKIRDVMDLAVQYATHMMTPLYSQVDPLYFGEAHRALELSIAYGKRVMSRYGYRTWTARQIEDLLQSLTWGYPSHSFVIDYFEAQKLRLNVYLMKDQLEDDAHTIFEGINECIGFLAVPEKKPVEVSGEPTGISSTTETVTVGAAEGEA